MVKHGEQKVSLEKGHEDFECGDLRGQKNLLFLFCFKILQVTAWLLGKVNDT